ncbi:hypothetical protein [Streptomyces qinzhouensis]|uniref:Uncharacterized protein n=1 Tax=Streptomyces qinzhouensis TaxID=2599401 RepID=A0A5B8JFK2_9ACTN|nr:hypothetical protein [Streptomyces qinzhouensis]QDY76490.1 hypothetical protein FQU76_08000 [Streptomyces qinzhouensis]
MTYQLTDGNLPLHLPGTFKPWAVQVGHSKILLRGFLGGGDGSTPRVFDVLFQDVSRISLADQYRGLDVTDAGTDSLRAEEQRVGRVWRESKLFRVSAENPHDYVVAGYLFWAEVSVFATETSPLMQESPKPGAIKDNQVFRVRWDR